MGSRAGDATANELERVGHVDAIRPFRYRVFSTAEDDRRTERVRGAG